MPFEVLETIKKELKASRPSISYMRFVSERTKKKNMPKLIVGIPRAILGPFKPKAETLYEFHVGSGKDAGRARIVPGKNGVAATTLKNFIAFRFGFVPALGDEIADKEFVDGRPIDGGFEIDLPAWFKIPGVPKKAA